MILEAIVTTLSPASDVNIAPMGPTISPRPEGEGSGVRGQHVDDCMTRFLLRPYPTSTTFQNLKAHGEGVLHVTDDVLLLAQAAVGRIEPLPQMQAAEKVRGQVLLDACRYYEFRVRSLDESEPRVRIEAEVVHSRRLRDFFGFNRAKHAVVEAAILATRTAFLPLADIQAEFRKLATLVEKTGGPRERDAFAFLKNYMDGIAAGNT